MSRCARSLPLAALVVALCLAPAAAGAAPPATDGPGALSHFDLARKDCVGTARNTTLEGLVHGRQRRAQRRLLPDQRQHQRRDAAVPRQRRLELHRPADARHDLHGPGDRRPGADLPRHHDGQERALQDRHRLHDRSVAPDRPHPLEVRRAEGQAVGLPPLRPPRPDAQRQRRRRRPATAAPTTAGWPAPAATRCSSARTSSPQTNAANRDYAIPVHSALDVSRGFDQATNGFAGQPSDGLVAARRWPRAHRPARHRDNGNVVQVGRVPLGHDGRFTLALGYGDTQAGAISASQRSLKHGFDHARRAYERGWNAYDASLVKPRAAARRLGPALERRSSTSTT